MRRDGCFVCSIFNDLFTTLSTSGVYGDKRRRRSQQSSSKQPRGFLSDFRTNFATSVKAVVVVLIIDL